MNQNFSLSKNRTSGSHAAFKLEPINKWFNDINKILLL